MHPLVNELKGIVSADRIREIRYDPLMRLQFYWYLPVPDHLRQKEPYTVVEVESAQEISQVLRLANQRNLPLYVRQGTGVLSPEMVRPEPPGSLILDLRRMRWVRPSFESAYVEVGPGVIETELNKELAPHGYAYPELIGPVAWGSIVSLNTSGRSVDPNLGKPGDYVLGLEVVLPTGEIIETGNRTVRRVCGFDLTRLLIGSQGLFGVITNIRLKLIPAPREEVRGIAHFPSLESFGQAISDLYKSRAPYAHLLEFMDQRYLELAPRKEPAPPVMVVIGTDGEAPGQALWKLEEILKVLRTAGAEHTQVLTGEQWGEIQVFRDAIYTTFEREGYASAAGEVMDVPLGSLAAALKDVRQLQGDFESRFPGVRTYLLGHIGGGSFHPIFAAPVAWGYERIQDVARQARQELLELKLVHSASIGEQGIFPEHKEWFRRFYDPAHLAFLTEMKRLFDPRQILNPRRFDLSSPE